MYPESDNKIPDILDEMMYNLKWMLTMQDPTDGGVYHKLTTPNWRNASTACSRLIGAMTPPQSTIRFFIIYCFYFLSIRFLNGAG